MEKCLIEGNSLAAYSTQTKRLSDKMKTYRNKQCGFEIDVPEQWLFPKGDAIKSPVGEAIVFGVSNIENFNILIGHTLSEPLDQIEKEFRRYAMGRQYSELEFGRIEVGKIDHVWARYHMGTGDWAKKYLIVFDEVEYDITATCLNQQMLAEREIIWDTIVKSFRLVTPAKSRETASILDRMNRAAKICEKGHSYFESGQYEKALEQFEKGKMVTHEFPWNFFGASMTLMQMVEMGAIPEDQYGLAVANAEKNLQACLLISPREKDYLDMMNVIQEYKKKYPL